MSAQLYMGKLVHILAMATHHRLGITVSTSKFHQDIQMAHRYSYHNKAQNFSFTAPNQKGKLGTPCHKSKTGTPVAGLHSPTAIMASVPYFPTLQSQERVFLCALMPTEILILCDLISKVFLAVDGRAEG